MSDDRTDSSRLSNRASGRCNACGEDGCRVDSGILSWGSCRRSRERRCLGSGHLDSSIRLGSVVYIYNLHGSIVKAYRHLDNLSPGSRAFGLSRCLWHVVAPSWFGREYRHQAQTWWYYTVECADNERSIYKVGGQYSRKVVIEV